jgi:hypothetical protein
MASGGPKGHHNPHAEDVNSKGEQHAHDKATPGIADFSMDQKEPTMSNDNQALQLQTETADARAHQDAVLNSSIFNILEVRRGSNR